MKGKKLSYLQKSNWKIIKNDLEKSVVKQITDLKIVKELLQAAETENQYCSSELSVIIWPL